MSKRAATGKRENPGNLYILPIAFIITIVPLIVYMKVVQLSPIEIKNWYGQEKYSDFFTFFKSQWLIIGTALAAVFYFVYLILKGFKFQKSIPYIPTAVYALMIILSTLLSKNRGVALNGFVARYEGMWALLCYLILMVVTINLVKTESQMKFLLSALLISASIIGIIGVFQFFNMDLFRTDFGKKLILPEIYHQMLNKVSFRFEESMIFSTFSNPNYVGSYMALVIPITFAAFLYFKKLWLKIGAGLLTVISLVSLFGSRSRAGLMGLAVSVLVALVLFRKIIFRRKLLSMAIAVGLVLMFLGVNFALNGVLIDRIISEFKQPEEVQFFDLQDITFEDKTVSIVSKTETFVIRMDDSSKLYFCDDAGNELPYDMEGMSSNAKIKFTDPKYKDYTITIDGAVLRVNQKQVQFEFAVEDEKFKLIGLNDDLTNTIEKAEYIGFKNKERFGSARGYIWSRTLPMLKDTILWGHGPDTYAIEFPQNDYIGKIRAYGTPQMLVDKPHNMYLQIAVNTGVLSLLAALALWGLYLAQSIRIYIKKMDYSFLSLSGAGIFLAVCGYLVTGLFNDSVVAIAPVFWVMLGLGFVCNGLVTGQSKKMQSVRG